MHVNCSRQSDFIHTTERCVLVQARVFFSFFQASPPSRPSQGLSSSQVLSLSSVARVAPIALVSLITSMFMYNLYYVYFCQIKQVPSFCALAFLLFTLQTTSVQPSHSICHTVRCSHLATNDGVTRPRPDDLALEWRHDIRKTFRKKPT